MRWLIIIALIVVLVGCGGSTVDVSKIDPDTILRQGDLPPGITATVSNAPNDSEIKPPPTKSAHRQLTVDGAPIGAIILMLYANKTEMAQSYDNLKDEQPLDGIGDVGSMGLTEAGGAKAYRYVFQRCSAIISASFLDVAATIPSDAELQKYMKRLDGRLQESAVCTK